MSIITKNEYSCNKQRIYLKPTKQESLCIQFRLKSLGFSYRKIGDTVGVSGEFVLQVVRGIKKSHRVETKIAHILGYDDWSDVVIEARLALTEDRRPTLTEITQAKQEAIDKYIQWRIDRRQKVKKALSEAKVEVV